MLLLSVLYLLLLPRITHTKQRSGYMDKTHMYLNTQTQYYNNQSHVGSIIPLKSIIYYVMNTEYQIVGRSGLVKQIF